MNKIIDIFLLLITIGHALEISVSSLDYKCMVVYSTSLDHHLKIDMKFPTINSDLQDQHYSIVLLNTQTEEQQQFTIKQGTLRKEIQLAENIIYKLCIKIILNHSGSSNMQQYIEYKTSVKHATVHESKIQIPKNLLRVHDLSESFSSLISLGYTLQGLQGIKNQTQFHEQTLFEQQNEKIKKIEFISFIQLAAIVVIGGYQYYSLKNIIQNRHK